MQSWCRCEHSQTPVHLQALLAHAVQQVQQDCSSSITENKDVRLRSDLTCRTIAKRAAEILFPANGSWNEDKICSLKILVCLVTPSRTLSVVQQGLCLHERNQQGSLEPRMKA